MIFGDERTGIWRKLMTLAIIVVLDEIDLIEQLVNPSSLLFRSSEVLIERKILDDVR